MNQQPARRVGVAALLLATPAVALAQFGPGTQWTKDGYSYYEVKPEGIVQLDARVPGKSVTILSKEQLLPAGQAAPLDVRRFALSDDGRELLLNTNTKKVWRYDTRGDYWVYDLGTKQLTQLGKSRPASSLMFAKFSPDGKQVAYVSEHNLYVESLADHRITPLTTDGTNRLINGTFDWVYEEELDCRDGFRWAPDGQSLAYWQLDARPIKNYLMLNSTDALYPYTVPVEYPVVGQDPSRTRIGVVPVSGGTTRWLDIPGDAVQHYLPRMEWSGPQEVIVQQLNRRQNESNILLCNTATGAARQLYHEQDAAWIDAKDEAVGWDWLDGKKRFVWSSEQDGWRHLYAIDHATGKTQLLTPGDYDVIKVSAISEEAGMIYFTASPTNATQVYLYRVPLKGGAATRVTPADLAGTNGYDVSPNGKIALHDFSSATTPPLADVVSLPAHQRLSGGEANPRYKLLKLPKPEFFQVKTVDGVTLDGWMVKPTNFDPKKKYPIVFTVYGEPASQTVVDRFGTGFNRLYQGSMADDGYIYASLDNRGAPAPRGRAWRKAIYHNIGSINIRDQAMGAKEVLKNPWVDTTRVAVWGWSGGGSSTLNLLFQYPQIYKTGISIAAVDNQLNYDNIYQERYMGLLPDDKHYFVDNSPLAHAKGLRGNLLLIHGTGDDNVHYNNAEQMINELVKQGKTFQMMAYPNRTHSISEGEGTSRHLAATYTKFLKENCPPGGR
ncbi:MAG: DPP IV N-terminal domain-containing protein [Janthinobacterium lividum]